MFQTAVDDLSHSGASISSPEVFNDFLKRTSQDKTRTPEKISVQSYSRLDKTLKEGMMTVFRLGAAEDSNNTKFGLAKIVNGWQDYFFLDKDLFDSQEIQAFIPKASYRDLYAFSLIPKFTETTLVNFSMASGLLQEALELDEYPSIPVTGQSTFSFNFYPRLPEDG